jgi:hypothetical protein
MSSERWRPRPASERTTVVSPSPPSSWVFAPSSTYEVSVRERRDPTTTKCRVSLSVRTAAPVPVVAVIVSSWVPTLRAGSGTPTVANALAAIGAVERPRLFELTLIVTGASASSAVP